MHYVRLPHKLRHGHNGKGVKISLTRRRWENEDKNLRPCVWQKFPNFSFSRVSEMFGFQSLEFFRKNPNFSNSLVKKPCFWVKKFGNSCFGVKNRGFRTFGIYGIILNLFYSELYEKMTLKLNFGNREKLVPTWKLTWMFGLKFGMQGLTKIVRLLSNLKHILKLETSDWDVTQFFSISHSNNTWHSWGKGGVNIPFY